MRNRSIATIDSPEFINLQPLEVNPLMSKCEIKVLYVGENRNHSFITKEVASEMAKTLRGAPIVGYFKEEDDDFRDHGHKMVIEEDQIKFECLTKPFGFVDLNADVWFQKFTDTDEFGNNVEREYMMTTGYLWTEQFKEAKRVIEEGRPQSMELDEESLDGNWATNPKNGIDFFIINDAVFSKLCILGEDVEPCFEGASITAPEVSTSFTKMDDNFKNTLFAMMQDLKFALEGGNKMDEQKQNAPEIEEEVVETPVVEENVEVEPVAEEENTEAPVEEVVENVEESVEVESEEKEVEEEKEENEKNNDISEQSIPTETEENIEANLSTEEEKEESVEEVQEEEAIEAEEEPVDNSQEKYALLEKELEDVKAKYSLLEKENEELTNFKNEVMNEKKDELIKGFYMLSDEDKADVIEHKAEYSLDDIESKLSVICVRKKVNFDLDKASKEEDKDIVTYNLGSNEGEISTPAWIKAIRNTRDSNK